MCIYIVNISMLLLKRTNKKYVLINVSFLSQMRLLTFQFFLKVIASLHVWNHPREAVNLFRRKKKASAGLETLRAIESETTSERTLSG